MKKNSRYIILIIILVLYFVILYFFIGKDYVKKGSLTTKLIIGEHTVWQLEKRKWTNISDNKTKIKNLNWQEFNVFVNSKKLGKYDLWKNESWYIFDKEKNAIQYQGQIFAYQANYEINLESFKEEKITNYSPIRKVLENSNLSTEQELTVNTLIKYDFDSDSNEEELYLISNAFPEPEAIQPEKIFTFIFLVDNNEIEILYNSVEENVGLNGCQPFLEYLLDVDDDNENELILSCIRYDELPPLVMLYDRENDKFDIVVSNE